MQKHLKKDRTCTASSGIEKVVHLNNYRFSRDLNDYKSEEYSRRETFNERLEKKHPYSKHGHGMWKAYDGLMADQIMEESLRESEENEK